MDWGVIDIFVWVGSNVVLGLLGFFVQNLYPVFDEQTARYRPLAKILKKIEVICNCSTVLYNSQISKVRRIFSTHEL